MDSPAEGGGFEPLVPSSEGVGLSRQRGRPRAQDGDLIQVQAGAHRGDQGRVSAARAVLRRR